MTDDRLERALEQIRARKTGVAYAITVDDHRLTQAALDSQADVPRLLGAIEAVHELATMMRTEAAQGGPQPGWAQAKAYYAALIDGHLYRALLGEES